MRKRKKRWPAFTLIEMMVSLTLFAIAILTITNLLSTSVRLMDSISGSDDSRTQAMLLSRIMEATVRDAHSLSVLSNHALVLQDFKQNRHFFTVKDKTVIFDQLDPRGVLSRKVFTIEKAQEIDMIVRQHQGRHSLSLYIQLPQQEIKKTMLLGYKKGVSAK